MRHQLGWTLGLAALLTSCAHPVDAQVRRIFVGAGAIADNDRTNSRLTEHPAGSWTLVVGAEVQRHLGIRLTVDAPRETSSVTEGVYTSGDFLFPFRQRLTRSRRSMTFAVLADVHGNVAPRLRIAATCGIANVTHDTETIATRERSIPMAHCRPWRITGTRAISTGKVLSSVSRPTCSSPAAWQSCRKRG